VTTTYVASAPGKLFLLGEYAVLDGCPAVVAAIDRRVRATVTVANDTDSRASLRICAPGHGVVEFESRRPPAAVGPLRFAIAAYRAVAAAAPRIMASSVTITTATELGGTGDRKTGMGSSAAVTVAVTAALLAAAGEHGDGLAKAFSLALAAHREGQNAIGSGADVAAAIHGGVVRVSPTTSGVPMVERLPWPSTIRLLVGWSGAGASTPDLVRQYRNATARANGAHAAFLRQSRECVEAFVAGLARGTLSAAAVDGSGCLLESLGERLGVPITTALLQDLLHTARACGAAAKISGSGGGDCGIAMTEDPSTAARVVAAWESAGLVPLDVAVCSTGVTLERV
jgi:phosphomevalonate kinase